MVAFLDLLDTDEEKSKFIQLYDKYHDLLMWIAMGRLKNHHLAEEVVQEAFLYVAKNFNKIGDVNSRQTKGYLSRVVEGLSINKYNKEQKIINLSADEEEYITYARDDDEFFDNLEMLDLKDAVSRLSDESQNYLYFTYVYGYTSNEIAEMYNISPDLVRKKIQFAKRDIRKYFEEENNGRNKDK